MRTETAPVPSAPRPPSLRRSLAVQQRVIWALLMREVITRFGRRNLGVLWLVVEPMLFTLGVALFWSATRATHGSNIPIFAFAITGYSSVLVWRNTVSQCTHAIQSNLNLLYHRNVLPIDVFAARIWLEIVGASGSFAILACFFTAVGLIQPPVDPLLVLVGWFMLSWFGGSLALLIGAATSFSELIKRLWTPVSYLLFPLSGAAFMVEWLAPGGREVVLMLPMVHGVEMLREGYFGNVVPTHHDIVYMAQCNLVLLFFGLVLLRLASRHVEAE